MGAVLSKIRSVQSPPPPAPVSEPVALRLRRPAVPPRPATPEAMARSLNAMVRFALPNMKANWQQMGISYRHTALSHATDVALGALLAWDPNDSGPAWDLMVAGMRSWVQTWAFRESVWLVDPAILAQPMRTWPWFDPQGAGGPRYD